LYIDSVRATIAVKVQSSKRAEPLGRHDLCKALRDYLSATRQSGLQRRSLPA